MPLEKTILLEPKIILVTYGHNYKDIIVPLHQLKEI